MGSASAVILSGAKDLTYEVWSTLHRKSDLIIF